MWDRLLNKNKSFIVDFKLISRRPQKIEVKYEQVYSAICQEGHIF